MVSSLSLFSLCACWWAPMCVYAVVLLHVGLEPAIVLCRHLNVAANIGRRTAGKDALAKVLASCHFYLPRAVCLLCATSRVMTTCSGSSLPKPSILEVILDGTDLPLCFKLVPRHVCLFFHSTHHHQTTLVSSQHDSIRPSSCINISTQRRLARAYTPSYGTRYTSSNQLCRS